MTTEMALRIALLAVIFLLIYAVFVMEKLRAIILRYERLLAANGIPHSRRGTGPKGFYSHARQ